MSLRILLWAVAAVRAFMRWETLEIGFLDKLVRLSDLSARVIELTLGSVGVILWVLDEDELSAIYVTLSFAA